MCIPRKCEIQTHARIRTRTRTRTQNTNTHTNTTESSPERHAIALVRLFGRVDVVGRDAGLRCS